jgi:flagellar biosynthesis component FlhA
LIQQHLKVEWITAATTEVKSSQSEEIIPPSAVVLNHLLELVRRGNLRELAKQADLLEPEFANFAEQVIQLAKSYQEQELFNFINQFC